MTCIYDFHKLQFDNPNTGLEGVYFLGSFEQQFQCMSSLDCEDFDEETRILLNSDLCSHWHLKFNWACVCVSSHHFTVHSVNVGRCRLNFVSG